MGACNFSARNLFVGQNLTRRWRPVDEAGATWNTLTQDKHEARAQCGVWSWWRWWVVIARWRHVFTAWFLQKMLHFSYDDLCHVWTDVSIFVQNKMMQHYIRIFLCLLFTAYHIWKFYVWKTGRQIRRIFCQTPNYKLFSGECRPVKEQKYFRVINAFNTLRWRSFVSWNAWP